MGKGVFNIWYWDHWISTCSKTKLGPHLTLYTETTKRIKCVSTNCKTQKTTWVTLHDLGLGNGFLDTTQKAQARKMDKLDFIEQKFCASKDTIKKMKTTYGKKILPITCLTRF